MENFFFKLSWIGEGGTWLTLAEVCTVCDFTLSFERTRSHGWKNFWTEWRCFKSEDASKESSREGTGYTLWKSGLVIEMFTLTHVLNPFQPINNKNELKPLAQKWGSIQNHPISFILECPQEGNRGHLRCLVMFFMALGAA